MVVVLTRRRLIALSAGSALALSLSDRAAWAQTQSLDWPNRVVRFIVPFAAGGPTDIVARVVTEQLSKIWGQQAQLQKPPLPRSSGPNGTAPTLRDFDLRCAKPILPRGRSVTCCLLNQQAFRLEKEFELDHGFHRAPLVLGRLQALQ
jgi:hypothetical protein